VGRGKKAPSEDFFAACEQSGLLRGRGDHSARLLCVHRVSAVDSGFSFGGDASPAPTVRAQVVNDGATNTLSNVTNTFTGE